MSHFTTVQTKINDLACLNLALQDLGYSFEEARNNQLVTVLGYEGDTTQAHISIHASKTYDVGIVQTQNGYEMVADWWGIETTLGKEQKEFVDEIMKRYSYHKVMKEIRARGYTLVEETEGDTIELTVRKWGD